MNRLNSVLGAAALGVLLAARPASAQTVPAETVAAVPASARLQPVILPPDPKPAIHGPRIIGATPGRPFLFRIPATGDAPLVFACTGLPPGLALDAKTGILSGTVAAAGRYALSLSVTNAQGKAARTLTAVCGPHALALTPPMGWDAINLYANTVDDAKVRAAADDLVKSGLAAHGWTYIHLNDTWQGVRDKGTGAILPNLRRFPDMKALGGFLHGQGLKFGLTSAPTEHTCGGYAGSLGHVALDADTYAAWGVDYLEYDWCPVPTLDAAAPPDDQAGAYKQMRLALDKSSRDILLAANTFGESDPSDWEAGVNTWITSRQVFDDWKIVARALFDRPWTAEGSGPGHWASPGLLMAGKFGVGAVRSTRLTAAEQMAQLSLSALRAAPLWVSCDLASLDPNRLHRSTTAMLTNDEVLDIDQDALGAAATQIPGNRMIQIWSKPLADGTVAVGLFNLAEEEQRLRVTLAQLALHGPQPVRDLWLHQDLGDCAGAFATDIPSHGVALLKIGRPK